MTSRLIVNAFEHVCMRPRMAGHLPVLFVEDVECYIMLLITSRYIAFTDSNGMQ